MTLLWWLFRHKNVMPWEVYERSQGYRDLVYVFAVKEHEEPPEQPVCPFLRRRG